jgi:hypothetical protein
MRAGKIGWAGRPARVFAVLAAAMLLWAGPGGAADRGKLQAFLQVTGFDVALDSIALSAADAPEMLGLSADQFGYRWKTVTDQVFDTEKMRGMALDILEATLSDELLDHAAAFYASPLGLRLVEAENRVHMEPDDEAKRAEGERIVAELAENDPARLDTLKRMNEAIDSSGTAVRAVQEIQIRFLIAASQAGVVQMKVDEQGLRALLKENEAELKQRLTESALAGSARTYRDFDAAELLEYTEALEDARMREVYELMNAIQWEIMADRFEVLATRMAGMSPGQEL